MSAKAFFSASVDTAAYAKAMRKIEGGLALAVAQSMNTVCGRAHAKSRENMQKETRVKSGWILKNIKSWEIKHRRSTGEFRDISKMRYISGSGTGLSPILDTGGQAGPRPRHQTVPIPTSAGRPNPARPIPRRLSLGPAGSAQGAPFGRHPAKLFRVGRGIWYRQGKPLPQGTRRKGIIRRRKMVLVRILVKTRKIGATHWHRDAMATVTAAEMQREFNAAAQRILRGEIRP